MGWELLTELYVELWHSM